MLTEQSTLVSTITGMLVDPAGATTAKCTTFHLQPTTTTFTSSKIQHSCSPFLPLRAVYYEER